MQETYFNLVVSFLLMVFVIIAWSAYRQKRKMLKMIHEIHDNTFKNEEETTNQED